MRIGKNVCIKPPDLFRTHLTGFGLPAYHHCSHTENDDTVVAETERVKEITIQAMHGDVPQEKRCVSSSMRFPSGLIRFEVNRVMAKRYATAATTAAGGMYRR